MELSALWTVSVFSELWTAASQTEVKYIYFDWPWRDIFLWTATAFSSLVNPPCCLQLHSTHEAFPRVHECISRVLEKVLFAYPLINKREQLSSFRVAVFTLGYFNDPNDIVLDQTTWHWLKIHIIIFLYHYILICSVADRLINNYLQGAQQLPSLSLISF